MVSSEESEFLSGFLTASQDALRAFASDEHCRATLRRFADLIEQSLRRGGKLMIAGNGGSAGDAQHIACEFVTRLYAERPGLSAMSLSADTSVVTASGNDYGYEFIFERQVRVLGREGDALLAISTSGKSANIVRALAAARAMGITTLGFSGPNAGPMDELCDCILRPPAPRNFLVQQLHIVAAHAVCGMLERRFFDMP